MNTRQTQTRQDDADFSIEEYGAKAKDKEECDEQLLAEFALMLTLYLTSVAALTGVAFERNRLPKRIGLFDLALLGVATHKLSRILTKDKLTSILRAPFVTYQKSAGAGEVSEEPRGRGVQRALGELVSCPYCMAPWCATALGFGFVFAPRVARFLATILSGVAVSDFLHRAYLKTKEEE